MVAPLPDDLRPFCGPGCENRGLLTGSLQKDPEGRVHLRGDTKVVVSGTLLAREGCRAFYWHARQVGRAPWDWSEGGGR